MSNSKPQIAGDLKWLAVDLDLTLAHSAGAPEYTLTEPITDNIRKLNECHALGYKIIIHTARHWEQYRAIEEWLDRYEIPYKAIVCGKLLAYRYIDDRAINADAEWKDYL